MPGRTGSGRVLVVIPSTQRRGAEVQGVALTSGLAARGWDASVIAVEPGRGSETLNIPALGASRRSITGLLRLRRMSHGAVVIAHGSSSLLAVGLATIGTRTPWVYRNIGDPAAWVATRWARMRTGWFMRRASAFAVLWPGAASSLRSLYRTRSAPMMVIPNDRDPQRFGAVSDDERRAARAALALDGPVVLFLGSLTAEKQPLVAVEAVSRMEGATLLVVGDGPMAPDVRELGDRLAPGRVRMLGVTDDPASVIAASDVLLLTSRTEGMPGVIIESMMRGVPVVAASVGAVPSMIDVGSTGYVVGVGDVDATVRALHEVLSGSADGFRAACRSRAVRDYSPPAVLDRWEELLGSLSAPR